MAPGRGAEQPSGASARDAFKTATELMQAGRHKEAVPYLQQVDKKTPDNPAVLWNLGIALANVGDWREAVEIWRRYQRVSPDDWQAMPKLIQCYQALGDVEARDKAIDSLRRYRETSSDAKAKSAKRFCREQCMMAGQRVFAFEYFLPEGPRQQLLRFSVLDAEGKEQYYLSLGSYEDTTAIARELGQIGQQERLYHLDEYRKGQHKTYMFFKLKPNYDQVRTNVSKILEGKLEPVSSTSKSSTNAVIILK